MKPSALIENNIKYKCGKMEKINYEKINYKIRRRWHNKNL